MDSSMRRRLRKFLPIVLMALTVQILAPIAACWAAGIAASNPLLAAEICSSAPASSAGQSDQTGEHRGHDGACSICCMAHAGASIDTPQPTAVPTPYLQSERVVWRKSAPDLLGSRTGSHPQARAPPQLT
jgi:hypothetical protein